MVASDRSVKYTKVLLEKGFKVSIITNSNTNLLHQLSDFAQDIKHPNLVIHRVPFLKYTEPNFLYEKDHYKVFKILSKLISAFFFRILYDWGIGWNRGVKKIAEKIITNDKVDVLFSSGAPYTPFWSLAKLSEKYKIPLVLDYRDLWARSPVGLGFFSVRFIANFIERYVNDRAFIVTTVSEGCAQILKLTSVREPSKIRVLYNFPSQKYEHWLLSIKQSHRQISRSSKLRLIYTGSIYPDADFSGLLSAIAKLDESDSSKLEFIYCGMSGDIVKRQFEHYNLGCIFQNKGFLSKEATVKELLDADILISVVKNYDYTEDPAISGIITTKIFDYIILGKCVLNICPKGSELLKLIDYYGIKNIHSFTGIETEQMKIFLLKMIKGEIKVDEQSNQKQMQWENQNFDWLELK